MNCLVLAAALIGSVIIPDGSLLFLQNSNTVVEKYTSHPVTHVGMVMNREGEAWLYEATPKQVRRIKLTDFYAELSEANRGSKKPIRVWLMRPSRSYSRAELTQMQKFLDSQLARRYSIRGYVRKKPSDGIHCAELAASTLNASGVFQLQKCNRISPGQLYEHADRHYEQPVEITLPQADACRSWCDRSWDWWSGFFDWCGWSCYETWTFCR